MIRSFRCQETESIFQGFGSRRFRMIERSAKRRLDALNAASSLPDLAAIRSNHLEALTGNRKGQRSIRINGQWRICFVWRDEDAWDVEITDYH
jgi:toxin HigB-1